MMQAQVDRIPVETEISLASVLAPRIGSLSAIQDPTIINAFIEIDPNTGEKFVRKRAGVEAYVSFNGGGGATGQGLWYYKGFLLAASDNNLTRVVSPTSSGFTVGSAWSNTFNGPFPIRQAAATAVFNGALFVIGGLTSAAAVLSDVWSSTDGKNWQQLVSGAPWGERSHMKALVFNNRLYVMGGASLTGFRNDVWVTDDGVNWSQVTGSAGWAARSGFAAVVYNNGMWVMGGSSGAALNDVWFSTDGTNWVQMVAAAGWAARILLGGVVFNNRIYVFGGTVGGREVWYTSDGINWTMATNTAFSSARYGFGYTVYNGAIWVACGFDGVNIAQVWNSTDGVAWIQVTAAFGGAARINPSLEVFKAPPTVSVVDAPTLYLMMGSTPALQQDIWYANIDGSLSTTYTIPSTLTAERMQAVPVNNNQYFALKDTGGMYVWYANTVTAVADKNYPPESVPGVVNLDETVYVMTPDALILGSAIGDPFTWPSRNFIGADFESDGGVALCKYGNFVMALGSVTLQLFYNSGAPSATLLRPYKNANIRVGCAFPYSVVEIEGNVIWVGRTESNQRSVYMMNGVSPTIISTPWVDMAINQPFVTGASSVRATFAKFRGKSFYILSIPTLSYSLAYDVMGKSWWLIGNAVYGYWPFSFYATDGTNDYTMYDGVRQVLTWGVSRFLDVGNPIYSEIRTAPVDHGTKRNKFCNRIVLDGDRTVSATVTLNYSDDDYQTWSADRALTMDKDRATATRFGSFRRRAWRVRHSSNTDFRIKVIDLELRVGAS